MVDLTQEMAELMSALGRPLGNKKARALMFVSAYSGEGVSTVAREFGRCEAAFAKRPIWLIDADFRKQSHLEAIMTEPRRFGAAGPVSSASPDGTVFFSLTPPSRSVEGEVISDSRLLIARSFLDRRLWVTGIREHLLTTGQKIKLLEQSPYWNALSAHAQTIIVDVPAMERSDSALKLAAQMDGIILVISESRGDLSGCQALKSELELAGGRLLGIVYNKASKIIKEPDLNRARVST
jgi:Mrp family chromosome partitioning ATPase